ncbi:DUF2231 domain-containing protein [Pseudonocardia spinosispora]|uniref:DUF2231 domain-containing protein n=1 Tax=Pseudonocardia spinosispora TaxID=103441 RepID=UPI0003FF006A|nr:DUF2231 domain-containing protein [Pseudonocardia spinosispora]
MITFGGLPAHPLIIHAVVVLLPLAALGTLLVAARPVWRRTLGPWVFLIALVGTLAVPLATTTGDQLKEAMGGGGPLVEVHEGRADKLLPFVVLYAVVLLAALLLGRRADRSPGVLTKVTVGVAVLAAILGLVVTYLVIWIGHAGALAVWEGTGQ